MLQDVSEIMYVDERNDFRHHILRSSQKRKKEQIGVESARKRRESEKASNKVHEDSNTKRPFWDELENQCDGTLRDFDKK